MAERETIIGEGIRVSGEIRGDEDLLVRGRVDGKIQITQKLTVEEGAIIEADVDVRALIVSGTVVGNIVASESVKLLASARVVGNLASPRVSMDAGAAFRGRVDMGDVEAARSAVVARPAVRPAQTSEQVEKAAPPRIAIPAKAAPMPTRVVPKLSAPAPAVKTTTTSTPAVPTMPRVSSASSANAPVWAKKKMIKRR